MSANEFAEYFAKFEKMQTWMVKDLTKATTNARANFLVAMGVLNYIEILGGFCTKGSNKGRFKFVFKHLLPTSYAAVFDELQRLTTRGAYDCLRCGMTHEYLVKTYTMKKTMSSIYFHICGVDDVAEFVQNVLARDCGLELVPLEKDEYHLIFHNPRLIHDLNIAFEALKRKLIDNETGYRDKFVARCKDIRLEQLT